MRGLAVVTRCEDDSGWTFTVEVAADSPYFRGHFAGRPILPAVAQLALLQHLFSDVAGRPGAISRIGHLRLHRRVGPGDTLQVSLGRPDEAGASRFTIRRGESMISRGELGWSRG